MSSLPPDAGRAGATSSGDLLAGRYRLLDPLGTGGSSAVYRAWDEVEQAFRAVKVLDGSVAHSARVRERLLQEAELMSRLQHPNVVVVYQASADGERVFLVMELLLGGSLMERVSEDGPLPPRMASTVMGSVLSALQCAHDQGVVHRDVKPHNVLLDGKGTPKVTDFGIARSDDAAMTRTGTVLGTLAFMPPEQKLSARRVDLRSDVYAAGATLYTLLTGRFPHDLYAAQLDESISRELYKDIPPPLADVIRRATAFRVDARYASASAMQAAIAAAVSELPPDPESPPLVSPFRIGRARSRASLGPTLLGVTESAEPTDLAKVVTPTSPSATLLPVERSERPASSLGAWLGLLGVGALALAAVAWWVWPERDAAPVPAAIHLGKPDVGPAPVVDTGTQAERKPSPEEEPPEEEPEAEAREPGPSVKEGKDLIHIGAWEVRRIGSSKQKTNMTASLPANNEVLAAKDKLVRPYLALSCAAGRLRASLQTGLSDVDPDDVVVRLDGEELARVTANSKLVGELMLPPRFPAKMLQASRMEVGLGRARFTTFTLQDMDRIKAELEKCR
jgi:serine/threonine protein kinase